MNTRSDFTYCVQGNLIYITDLDNGGKSVTNDIENVIISVYLRFGKPLKDFVIIYKDSNGTIDEVIVFDNKFKDFKHLGATTLTEARVLLGNRLID